MNPKKAIATVGIISSLALGSQVQVNPAPVSVQEFQNISVMYNHEIEKFGGSINIKDFKGNLKEINDVIRTRKAENEVYAKEREDLLKRTESQTVLEALLN